MGKYTDTFIHVFIAVIMLALAQLMGGVGLALGIGLLFLARELAQADPNNIFAALKTMPQWGWHKQAEWLAPLIVTLVLAVAT